MSQFVSSLRIRVPPNVGGAFGRVKRYVSRRVRIPNVTLNYGCGIIQKERLARSGVVAARTLMHVGHAPGKVCTAVEVRHLPSSFLVAMFLHEFGHIASRGDDQAADAWVMQKLGIPIEYRTKYCLEWVSPELIRRRRI